jgi:methionine synthase II (cobalamin-independent)
MELTADIPIEELVNAYPQAVGFLADRGLICIRCGEPFWGTLRELADSKNMGGQIEAIVQDLKTALEKAVRET